MKDIKIGFRDAEGFYGNGTVLDGKTLTTELNTTYAKFVDESGNPLTGKHVVIKVSSTTGEILDIVAEA